MQIQSPKTSGNRNRVSGFLRLFVLSLLTAAFAFTSLHAQTVAYVTNFAFGSNSVSVIDTSTNTLTATIPVGVQPVGVVLTPDGTRAFVTNFNDGTISVIDTASNTVAATISIGGGPGVPATTPDGKRVYVPNLNGTVVIDTATNSVVSTISGGNPFAVAITPDGSRAYILGFNNLAVVDTATNTVLQNIGVRSAPLFFPSPLIAITPDGGTVYVGGGQNSSVQAISTASNSVVATVTTSGVLGLAVSPDGSRVYGSEAFAQSVFIIDTATNTLEPATIPVGSFPTGVAVTPDGAFVYVANQNSNNLSVISTASNTVVVDAPSGQGPYSIAIASLSTPFSQFSITGLTVNKKGFTESGTVTLGANSSGLNLAAQPVTLTVDGFSLTIPGGSFKQVGGNMHFVFSGTINGLPVSMTLAAINGTNNSFKYSITVNGVDLTGQPNPATVGLKIGSNNGSTTAPF